jgi:hypothetical protein
MCSSINQESFYTAHHEMGMNKITKEYLEEFVCFQEKNIVRVIFKLVIYQLHA